MGKLIKEVTAGGEPYERGVQVAFISRMNDRGFTLSELLATMTIAAILFGIGLFALSASRRNARNAERQGKLQVVRGALSSYFLRYHVYPETPDSKTTADLTDNSLFKPFVAASLKDRRYSDPLGEEPRACYERSTSGGAYRLVLLPEPAAAPEACPDFLITPGTNNPEPLAARGWRDYGTIRE